MTLVTAVFIAAIIIGILHFIYPDIFGEFYEVFDITKVILWKHYTEKMEKTNCIFTLTVLHKRAVNRRLFYVNVSVQDMYW